MSILIRIVLLQVLNLRNYFDITEILSYPERFEIDVQLQGLVDSVQVPTVNILVEDAIRKLAQSQLKDFDADKFTDNVSIFNCNFACYNLRYLHLVHYFYS